MRIWHYKVLSFLPDSLLLTLWDDLVRVTKGERDLFTNFITDEEKTSLFIYIMSVDYLLISRNLKNSEELQGFIVANYADCLNQDNLEKIDSMECFEKEHDFYYLAFCVSLLNEYYALGLKDYSEEQHESLMNCVEYELKHNLVKRITENEKQLMPFDDKIHKA